MTTIRKYPLAVEDRQTVALPTGAQILTVQTQHNTPCLWALVEARGNYEERTIWVFGTGHHLDCSVDLAYIGTFQLHDGALVFHVFEETE